MTDDNKKIAFDPWTATFEQALEASKIYAVDSPDNPIYQYCAVQEINAMRGAIEAGDGFAVLACIRKVVTRGLIAPTWLALAFNKRYDSVLWCKAKSWDDPKSFGRPYPPNFRLAAARKARKGRLIVYIKIRNLLEQNPHLAIDKSLFESVGKTLGYGTTLTEEYYYQGKKLYGFNKKSR
ncbi:MAG: hypothetical protein KDI39_17255 [Pseudomonadales bacterium]|nr:hypothetical protein [Pseudomonadales bacterium]